MYIKICCLIFIHKVFFLKIKLMFKCKINFYNVTPPFEQDTNFSRQKFSASEVIKLSIIDLFINSNFVHRLYNLKCAALIETNTYLRVRSSDKSDIQNIPTDITSFFVDLTALSFSKITSWLHFPVNSLSLSISPFVELVPSSETKRISV